MEQNNYKLLNIKCLKTGNMQCEVDNIKFILNVKCALEAPYPNEVKGKLAVNVTGANYLESDNDFVIKARSLDRLLRDKVFNLQELKVDDSRVWAINIYFYILSFNKNIMDYMFEALKQYVIEYKLVDAYKFSSKDIVIDEEKTYVQTVTKGLHSVEIGVFNDNFAFMHNTSTLPFAEGSILQTIDLVSYNKIPVNIDSTDLL